MSTFGTLKTLVCIVLLFVGSDVWAQPAARYAIGMKSPVEPTIMAFTLDGDPQKVDWHQRPDMNGRGIGNGSLSIFTHYDPSGYVVLPSNADVGTLKDYSVYVYHHGNRFEGLIFLFYFYDRATNSSHVVKHHNYYDRKDYARDPASGCPNCFRAYPINKFNVDPNWFLYKVVVHNEPSFGYELGCIELTYEKDGKTVKVVPNKIDFGNYGAKALDPQCCSPR